MTELTITLITFLTLYNTLSLYETYKLRNKIENLLEKKEEESYG